MYERKFSHYFKPVPPGTTHIDVYRLLLMFEVTDPCLQHAVTQEMDAMKAQTQTTSNGFNAWKDKVDRAYINKCGI